MNKQQCVKDCMCKECYLAFKEKMSSLGFCLNCVGDNKCDECHTKECQASCEFCKEWPTAGDWHECCQC